MLKVFNTLTGQKEEFKTIDDGIVKIYSCGPTVYSYVHIGNLSHYLFVDMLKRYLRFLDYSVMDVMNITDVDDKTIKASRENGKSLEEYTTFYTRVLFEDFEKLSILRPTIVCNATDYIADMINLIQILIGKGYAYKSNDGSVYFRIAKFKEYGKLSHLNQEDLKVGASGRLNQDEYNKDNVCDFVLWKAWTEKDGDIFWESPFGKGRPGWHIECSAMSMKRLGKTLDIHTGAVDLIFPHHENEIAQSEAATGHRFVRYWMHRGFLKVNNEKMSKSLGNFYTLNDILMKVADPLALRYLILSNHYRMGLNFTYKSLESSENTLIKIRNLIDRLQEQQDAGGDYIQMVSKIIKDAKDRFIVAMDDDLNTPQAMVVFFDFVSLINKMIDENKIKKQEAESVLAFLRELDRIFAFIFPKAVDIDGDLKESIEQLIKKRNEYRENQEWDKADGIKDRILKMGVLIKDEKNETKWYYRK